MTKKKFENINILRSKALNKIKKNINQKKSLRILNHFIDLKNLAFRPKLLGLVVI